MALVEPIHPDDICKAIDEVVTACLGWQISLGELQDRLADASQKAAAVLNAPYYESDLTPRERWEAEQEYDRPERRHRAARDRRGPRDRAERAGLPAHPPALATSALTHPQNFFPHCKSTSPISISKPISFTRRT